MRLVGLVVVLAACGNELVILPDALAVDDPNGFRRLELHVLSGPDRVVVYAREPDRPCTCSDGEFPLLGTCAEISDSLGCQCTPEPAFCIQQFRVESNGDVIAEFTRLPGGQSVVMSIPNLPSVPAPQLVIEGCGARAEIPIGGVGPLPSFTATRTTDNHLVVDWTTDRPAANAIIAVSNGFFGDECGREHAVRVPKPRATRLVRQRRRICTRRAGLPADPFGAALVYTAGMTFLAARRGGRVRRSWRTWSPTEVAIAWTTQRSVGIAASAQRACDR